MTDVERLRKIVEMWFAVPNDLEERRELAAVLLGFVSKHPEAVAEILSMPLDAVPHWVMSTCADAAMRAGDGFTDTAIVLHGAAVIAEALLGAVPVFKTGDAVTIEFEGTTLPAVVELASRNGRSLMLTFDALVGGFVGMMPVMWSDARRSFLEIVQQRPVVVRETGRK